MKKYLVLALVVVISALAALTSCSKESPAEPGSPTATFTAENTGTVTETATPSATATITPTASVTSTATATATFTNTPIDKIISEAALDGWVDSSGGSGDNASYAINVGDSNGGSAIQGIVSFDLSGVSGPITSAKLRVYLSWVVNTHFEDIAPAVNVSHITPNVTVFNSANLYLIHTANANAGIICNSYTYGWYELNVTGAVEDDIANSRQRSQFRLYLSGITDSDGAFDALQFYSSDNSEYKPELVLEY